MSTQNKSLLLKTFHKQLFDFLDDIISIMPDNHELVKSKVYFTTLKQANPTLIIKIWYQYILLPYRDLIESGNVDFFLESLFQTSKKSFSIFSFVLFPIRL